MKNLNTQLIILLAAVSVMGVGCSKSSSNSDSTAAAPAAVAVSPVDAPAGASGTTSSNEVAFSPVSLNEMNAYVGITPLNNPTDVRLQVNLSNVGSNRYGGTIKISYTDNGYRHEGNFYSCLTSNCINPKYDSYGTSRDNGVSEAKYNYWFTLGGKTVFSGFFQDSYGAIMLIIDNVNSANQGDGQGGVVSQVVSGQIWYRNYAQTFAPQSTLRACWFIYAGPYDCRSGIGMNKSALYPTDSYRKLGDFTGLTFTN